MTTLRRNMTRDTDLRRTGYPPAACGKPQPHGQAGFTLIEMMVVIAVIAILTMTAVPSMQSLVANNRIVSATNDVVMGLNLAKSEAIRQNVSIRYCVNTSSGAWRVETTGGTAVRTGSLAPNIGINHNNSLDTDTVNGSACVRFRPNGISYKGGNTLIVNGKLTVSKDGTSRDIYIKTGAIHVG